MTLKQKIESKNSDNTSKSSKIDGIVSKKKPLTKPELMVKFKALEETNAKHLETITKLESCIKMQQRNETSSNAFKALEEKHRSLVQENIKNLETIERLEKNQDVSKKQEEAANVEQVEVVTQTEITEFCKECDYPASDVVELTEHLFECHMIKECDKYSCNFCNESFTDIHDLMRHKKAEHVDRVSICRNFMDRNCTYSDEDCWFDHSENLKACDKTDFNCTSCDKVFKGRSEFMKHRKIEHSLLVPLCRDKIKGSCMYSDETCWFVHDSENVMPEEDKNEKVINYNQEVFDKLFGMIEKITERIIMMENVI